MSSLEELGEVISTDLLIVGGGLAGLAAAIKAKENPVDVLVVDKETIGWSGKAPKTGGIAWLVAPEDDLDKSVEEQIKRTYGDYLNDQELLYAYSRESYAAVEQFAEWGVKFTKTAEGKLDTYKPYPFPRTCSYADFEVDMLFPLRAKARKMGTKMLNKIELLDLLKQDDRVVGAVGFNVINGRFYILKAKATILANGSCDFMATRDGPAAGGEGIAAAYWAGAEMRNAEFGNLYVVHVKASDSYVRGAPINYIFNAQGENISKKYIPDELEDNIALVLGMDKEIREGRGPIYVDFTQMKPFEGQERCVKPLLAHVALEQSKAIKMGLLAPSPKQEVTAGLGAILSPVKVDHEMKTTVDGLWGIGDVSWSGSAWGGAAAPTWIPGTGVMTAILSALRGGPSASSFASKAAPPEVSYDEVKRLKENAFAPMRRSNGLSPADAIYAVQEAVCPVKYNLRRSKDRLEEALSMVAKVQERLPELWAKDGHGLAKCHVAKAMALCAEMNFRAALMRTESRGWHFREDYPKRDDKNWLKWIILKQEAGKMVLSTEPVPIDKYRFKP